MQVPLRVRINKQMKLFTISTKKTSKQVIGRYTEQNACICYTRFRDILNDETSTDSYMHKYKIVIYYKSQ